MRRCSQSSKSPRRLPKRGRRTSESRTGRDRAVRALHRERGGSMALVLVIDDSEDMLECYADIFSASQHRLVTATSAEEGLELVRTLRPEVVLLDMMMPGTDGLGFLARLPAECPAPLPAVIANSGFEGYREEAKRR